MEFNEKLQELRKRKGLTQEELAAGLFVSRTAVSKWESGRGYPSIDSLKSIAKFFSMPLDDLLSTDEVLTIAEEDSKARTEHFRDLVFGSLDLIAAILLFLPFFAKRSADAVQGVSLIALSGTYTYLTAAYFAAVIVISAFGALTLAMQSCQKKFWLKSKRMISLCLGALSVMLFIITLQPYAAVFSFILLSVKALTLLKGK